MAWGHPATLRLACSPSVGQLLAVLPGQGALAGSVAAVCDGAVHKGGAEGQVAYLDVARLAPSLRAGCEVGQPLPVRGSTVMSRSVEWRGHRRRRWCPCVCVCDRPQGGQEARESTLLPGKEAGISQNNFLRLQARLVSKVLLELSLPGLGWVECPPRPGQGQVAQMTAMVCWCLPGQSVCSVHFQSSSQ